MTTQTSDLGQWLTRVTAAKSADQVFEVMDEFRKLDWSDDDRSKMARQYMKVLERVGSSASTSKKPDENKGPDGPVWYEKM